MSEIQPLFFSREEVLELHAMQLDRYGGATGIQDSGLLESAIMMPQASFGGEYVHKSIFEMAAAYAFHIAENQPFVDGNKRTALAAALVFLDWHETEINDSDEKLYAAMIALAEKKIDKAGLATLFEKLGKQPLAPVHPWRACPYGEHWVRTHPLHVPPSKAHPDGSVTTRHAHCAHNPSGKDQIKALVASNHDLNQIY